MGPKFQKTHRKKVIRKLMKGLFSALAVAVERIRKNQKRDFQNFSFPGTKL
jgi:hypothetical protein